MNYSVSINDHDHGHLVTNDVNTYYHNGTVAASAMLAYADASGSPYPPSTFADPHQVAYGAYVTPYAHPEMYVDSSGVHSNEDSNETAEAKKEKAQKLEVFGSAETMNLPQAVILNIKISDFFKDLLALKTYHEVLSAICDDVEHVEPWEGFQKPSPAFIYMYKLYKMKMSDKQMRGMLEHENPYVVAIGLLYLRWSLPPTQLWQWFEPLIGDKTKFVVDKKHTSRLMGRYARDLLMEIKYFDIYFPRLPVSVTKELKVHLGESSSDTSKSGGKKEYYGDEIRRMAKERSSGTLAPSTSSSTSSHSRDYDDRRRHDDRRERGGHYDDKRDHGRSRDNYGGSRGRPRSPPRRDYGRSSNSEGDRRDRRDDYDDRRSYKHSDRDNSPNRYRKRSRSRSPSSSTRESDRKRPKGRSPSPTAKRSSPPQRNRSPSPTTMAKFASSAPAPSSAGQSYASLKSLYGDASGPADKRRAAGSSNAYENSRSTATETESFSVGGGRWR